MEEFVTIEMVTSNLHKHLSWYKDWDIFHHNCETVPDNHKKVLLMFRDTQAL